MECSFFINKTLLLQILKICPEFFIPDKTCSYVFDVDDKGQIEPHAVHSDKNKKTPVKKEKVRKGFQP
jgi:hypothetical protein